MSDQIPQDLRYTEQHEWVRADGPNAHIGITDYAQESLGDIVFVDLPPVGTSLHAGQPFGEIESTKSVSDLYAPVDGVMAETNSRLADDPGLVNRAPYDDGWLCRLEQADGFDVLLSAAEYTHLVQGQP